MISTAFIYVLKEPTTGEVRYVGKTTNIKTRLTKHCSEKSHNHRVHWIQHLKSAGQIPVIEVIDEVPIEHWQQWEVAWIKYFREQGCDLVNSTNGGEGVTQTFEIREKIGNANRGRKLPPISEEHRRKLSITSTGRKLPPKSPESRAKISAANKGRKKPPMSFETRAKLSAALRGNKNGLGVKRSPEVCARISLRNIGNTWNLGKKRGPYKKKLLSMAAPAGSN